MMIETGVDILEIQRIEKIMDRKPHFLDRFFTEKERAYFLSKNNRIETIAGNFAAKEAIAKAIGTGIRGFNMNELEVLRDDLGKPQVFLYENALRVASERHIRDLSVSISHSAHYAVAFVVAIKSAGGEAYE